MEYFFSNQRLATRLAKHYASFVRRGYMAALVTQHNTRVWHMSGHDTMLPLFSTIPPSKKILQLSVTAHYKIKSNNRYLFLNKS